MPEVTKSQLFNKLKTRSKGAYAKSRGQEAKARTGGGLPPNLQNAVCRLRNYKLAPTKTGDPYFQLGGIIVDPPELEGRRATFMWFINDSKFSTAKEEMEKFVNDLQLIDADEDGNEKDLPEREEGILDVMKELCQRGVAICFNTGKERSNGRSPNLFVQGLAEGYPDDPTKGPTEAVSRNQAATAKQNGKAADEELPVDDEAPPDAGDEGGEGGDVVDDSQEGAVDDSGSGEGDEMLAWEPAKDDQYSYSVEESKTVKDPKNPKKTKIVKTETKHQVLVYAVNTEKETVDVYRLIADKKGNLSPAVNKDKKKIGFRNVAWTDLAEAE